MFGGIFVVAHQGGWDELLLFVGPVAVAYLLIRVVERRSRRSQRERSQDETGSQNTSR